jgi:hypothetical protein
MFATVLRDYEVSIVSDKAIAHRLSLSTDARARAEYEHDEPHG